MAARPGGHQQTSGPLYDGCQPAYVRAFTLRVSARLYAYSVALSGAGTEVVLVPVDVTSVALVGTEARRIQVEVHMGQGLPGFNVVGLPTRSIREAEHRTQAAIVSTGLRWPNRKKILNLAPGALRKDGTHFDLPLAVGILVADEQIPADRLRDWVILGELGLDGTVRSVPGVLAAALAARDIGAGIMCPASNATEAALVQGMSVAPVRSLLEVSSLLRGEIEPAGSSPRSGCRIETRGDLAEVRGHAEAKRAAEIAAAGGHNLLLEGPPGSGKSMLAARMPSIFPDLTNDEALEVPSA